MHLRILFDLDLFALSILTLVSLIKAQAVWPNTKNINRWTGLDPEMGFTTGYQPSGSQTYGLDEAVSNLNYKESSYGLQLGSDFNNPFNEPGGYASSSKFSDRTSSFIWPAGIRTNGRDIRKPVDLNYKFYDWAAQFGPPSNYKNGFNMQQAEGNIANSGLGNVPVNNQNRGLTSGNVDMMTFNGVTVPVSNRNFVFSSGSLNNGAVKTLTSINMPEKKQNTGFNNEPLSNIEEKTFSSGPESYKILRESYNKTTEVHGRKQAGQKKMSDIRRRSRPKNHSRTKSLKPKISSDSDVQEGHDIINETGVRNVEKDTNDNSIITVPEASSVPAEKNLPSFLASAVNQFDTPSTVHYISSAVLSLVSDDEFDLASLPPVILALTMQIRSAFPGLSNCELLNQVFLELIIALGHILKHSKVGDVHFDSIAETAEIVMKAF